MILKLMILSSLHVYELIVTTSSLSSFRKPKSTLETPVQSMRDYQKNCIISNVSLTETMLTEALLYVSHIGLS